MGLFRQLLPLAAQDSALQSPLREECCDMAMHGWPTLGSAACFVLLCAPDWGLSTGIAQLVLAARCCLRQENLQR